MELFASNKRDCGFLSQLIISIRFEMFAYDYDVLFMVCLNIC